VSADTDAAARRLEFVNAVKTAILEGHPAPTRGNSRYEGKTAYQRAAEILGVSQHTVAETIHRATKKGETPDWKDIQRAADSIADPSLEKPDLPSGELPMPEFIEQLTARSDRILRASAARAWFKIKVNSNGPFGVAWLGDPHMDSPGCNWRLLRRDIDIIKTTPGLFAANCGDSLDNWWGRLITLKGRSFVTDEEAWRLVEWLIAEIGEDRWLLWLLGNHDTKNEAGHLWKRLCGNLIHMDDWQARFCLVPPNGRECRIWAAHSFPGHSMWNKTHGGQRAAAMSGAIAHLYIQGHHHEWQLMSTEEPQRHVVYWAAKARGYKFADDYGEHHGYFPQSEGATVVSIIDPEAETEAGFLHCFADLALAADYLTFIRRKRGA
jgi:hypothetical protein